MVKAQETDLASLLEGKKQYQVPLYQRVYSWRTKQVDQLWSDIVELSETRKTVPHATHFIGSVVLAASPDNGAVGITNFLVVDGQQRLTTLTLLLSALRDHLVDVQEERRARGIDAQYLTNPFDRGEPLKLVPTQADRPAYEAVLRSAPNAGGDDSVGGAYRAFRSKIAAFDDPDDPLDLEQLEHAIMRGLSLVAVTAEPGDNAHRIFESLNNTGLRLTQSDLLKNYLFMRLGDRADLVYHSVWLPLEKKLDRDSLELLFWLDLVQVDERAKQSDVYVGQQKRLDAIEGPGAIEAEISRIASLGAVFAAVLAPDLEPHAGIRDRLRRLRAWGSTTAYPVVTKILGERAAGRATTEQVERALLTLEAYFVRRILIGRATANLNRTLLQSLAALDKSSEPVDVALRDYLSSGRKYYGTDAQVRESVQSVAFYWQGQSVQKKLILQWLEESYGSKESVDPQKLTIEHVLPQTMTDDHWEDFANGFDEGVDLDYEHDRIVHTLGNLTLTGYNSELSNRPFDEKRALLAESGLRMNQEIATHSSWRAQDILERGARIAERVIAQWPGPDESVVHVSEGTSEVRAKVAALVSEIPAGRWTSYGEVAIVAGTYAQPLAAILANHPVPHAWRVLQASGTVSPGFRWTDPSRTDDPRQLLREEGIRFDAGGRAAPEQFFAADELAEAAGFDVDAEIVAERARRRALPGAQSTGDLGADQQAFYEGLKQYGQLNSTRIKRWRKALPQHWYDISFGVPGAHIGLTINTQRERVGVELYIDDDKHLFSRLKAMSDRIESELGFSVDWWELPDRKASRIIALRAGDFRDPAQADQLMEWMVETADTFARVMPQFL